MRFIVDAQLPGALVNWLQRRGYEARHVAELGLLSSPDAAVWEAALATSATVLTKDHDFIEWALTRDPAPQVVWIRIGNTANPALIARLDAVWDKVIQNLEAGALVVEAGGQ